MSDSDEIEIPADQPPAFTTVEEVDAELRRLVDHKMNTHVELAAAIDLERIDELLTRRYKLAPIDP